jgi:hypothetical protein
VIQDRATDRSFQMRDAPNALAGECGKGQK